MLSSRTSSRQGGQVSTTAAHVAADNLHDMQELPAGQQTNTQIHAKNNSNKRRSRGCCLRTPACVTKLILSAATC